MHSFIHHVYIDMKKNREKWLIAERMFSDFYENVRNERFWGLITLIKS